MSKYFIGEIGFKTKKARETYTRERIASIGAKQDIKPPDHDFYFLQDLLSNHKKHKWLQGSGVKSFNIRRNVMGKGFQTFVNRTDDTEDTFSWRKCCTQTTPSTKAMLNKAMRSTVMDHTETFKSQFERRFECTLCQARGSNPFLFHADHATMPFCKIRDTFLSEIGSYPKRFCKHPTKYCPVFRKQDEKFEKLWTDYHNKHAEYQILCASCNLKKGSNV